MTRYLTVVMVVVLLLISVSSALAAGIPRHPCVPEGRAYSEAMNYMSTAGKMRLDIAKANNWKWPEADMLTYCSILDPDWVIDNTEHEIILQIVNKYGQGVAILHNVLTVPDEFSKELNYMSFIGFVRWRMMVEYGDVFPRQPDLPIEVRVVHQFKPTG